MSQVDRAQINEIHDGVYLSAIRLHRTLRNYILILDLQTASCPSVPPILSRGTWRKASEPVSMRPCARMNAGRMCNSI
jgi:hypothetical protein